MDSKEKSKYFHAFFFPFIFVWLIWMIKLSEVVFGLDLSTYGVNPRVNAEFVKIFSMPLVHGDWEHLFSNSIPLVALGALLFYFYRPFPYRIFFGIYLFSGVFTWLIGRPSYHIGASGIVYGLVSFLFVSGVIRRHTGLMSISALTVIFYGSLIWGIFPFAHMVSWEGHLGGFLAGGIFAWIYRNEGPQRVEHQWTEDEELSEQLQWPENEEIIFEEIKVVAHDDPTTSSEKLNKDVSLATESADPFALKSPEIKIIYQYKAKKEEEK